MRFTTLYKHALLLTASTLAFSHMAYAADTPTGQNAANQAVQSQAKADIASAQKQVSTSAEQLLFHINQAQVAIDGNNRDIATQHVDRAITIAGNLKATAADAAHKNRAGIVTYTSEGETRRFVVPIYDEAMTVKEYGSGPLWSERKGLAVTDAEMVYLSLNVDNEKVKEELQKAKQELASNNMDNAEDALDDANDAITISQTKAELPLEKARDNLSLARNMVNQQFFDGARYALNNAEDALEDMEETASNEDTRKKIVTMRSQMASLSEELRRKDPTLLQKAKGTLETWWDDIKNW